MKLRISIEIIVGYFKNKTMGTTTQKIENLHWCEILIREVLGIIESVQ